MSLQSRSFPGIIRASTDQHTLLGQSGPIHFDTTLNFWILGQQMNNPSRVRQFLFFAATNSVLIFVVVVFLGLKKKLFCIIIYPHAEENK